MPSKSQLEVKLAPINLIERLNEHQSDEKIAIALLGLFGGAALGIVCNYIAIAKNIGISAGLFIFLALLCICIFIWLFRIRKRTKDVNKRLMGKK